jgi:hypothetical protein
MNRMAILLMAGVLVPAAAYAQSPAGAQAEASAQSQADANVNTQRSGLQASGNPSASAQANGSAQAAQNALALSEGTTMNAALAGSLDVKKNKPGDRIEARTTQDVKQDGKVVLRKGTHLVGHVTEVQARAKDQTQSQLGVVFDHADLRNGQRVPLNASIQALAAAQSTAQASAGDDDLIASGGGVASAAGSGAAGSRLVGGTLGGATRAVGGTAGAVGSTAGGVSSTADGALGSTVNAAAHSTGAVGGLDASGALASNSKGVFGLQGLSLDSAASSTTRGSLIVSSTRNVHLESGTQMVLQVAGRTR